MHSENWLTGTSSETNDGQTPPNPSELRLPQTWLAHDPLWGLCMLATQCAFAKWNETSYPLGNLLAMRAVSRKKGALAAE